MNMASSNSDGLFIDAARVRTNPRLRILVVEDDVEVIELLRTSLKSVAPDVELTVASRLASALAAIHTRQQDAVLLDLNLPDSTGLHTLRQVTALATALPIVVLTGMGDAKQAHEALRLGAEDWLVKPFGDPEIVVRALRYAVERKRLKEELIRLQKLEAVGRLARNVAHEFNNVLTAVVGNAALAEVATDAATRTAALRELQNATVRGALLTRQLVGVSRPAVASARVADVAKVVATLQGLFQAVLPRNIILVVEPIEAVRAAIAAEHLDQILLNLLLNARDAIAGRGTIVISVKRLERDPERPSGAASVSSRGSRVQIAVRDTGPGIQSAVLPHIFDPFFTTKGDKGSGLGLAISKELIERVGGTLRAESAPGAGATFTFDLPEVTP
jgi:signal transduction histidine kinase